MTQTAEVIYEDEETQVIQQDGGSDYLLITFADLDGLADGIGFFAAAPASKADISVIGFVAKRGNWYPSRNMLKAIEAIQDKLKPYTTRVLYGGSMGGYAAIKFSRAIGATHVIALCPQWSLDASECDGAEPGWSDYFNPDMVGMGIRSEDVAGEVFVLTDMGDPDDKFHASKIKQVVPMAAVVNVPMIGHYVTAVIAGTGNFLELLEAAFQHDIKRLRRFVRRTRRNHFIRFTIIMDRAYFRHKRLCVRLLVNRAVDNPNVLQLKHCYFFDCMKYVINRGGPGEGMALFRRFRATLTDVTMQLYAAIVTRRILGGAVAVKTYHGKYITYNFATNTCRGSGATVDDVPVDIELRDNQIVFSVAEGGARMFLRPDAHGVIGCATSPDDARSGNAFTITAASGGRFNLSYSGLYVCAEPSGRLGCNRPAAGDWEHFYFDVTAQVAAP